MEPDTYIESIIDHAAVLWAAGRAGIDRDVPSCPGWEMSDLVRHVGGIHRWAAANVRTGQRSELAAPPPGTQGEALVAWGEEGTAELVDALRAADPDADVWTFGLPRSVRFWLRRQAHETAVHAWDAANATGRPLTLGPDLSADGVDELLTVMLPRWFSRQEDVTWAGETIHLHRTDGEGEWNVTLGPAGAVAVERAHGKGDAAVRGPAAELLLWGYNRGTVAGLEVFGEERLVSQRWPAEIHF